ncbi:type VI secretion system contractile sheath large subunit [Dankookia rubra]|uniref:Type VI secretion system contractile sheath large subunit n=1 Tax=Dankookia rubra TaxID=1442381 RepID=A0A4R5QB55_9PROT|nr:type VI secretion system contractile sheath large subunit [Dankookia rubra]TDH59799.1 type VI secretion system contractile sheath large subunit [Dankookia rubra]
MTADPVEVWTLAALASLASRVEPQLLRRLRLELAPRLDATVEAALWFSPDLVSMRAPTGLILSAEALPALRGVLAVDPSRLDAAWAITAEMHAAAAPALRVEEELTYLALKGLGASATEARARGLLRDTLRTMLERGGGGLPAWAERALQRMPREVLELEEARMVAHGAALRLGRSGLLAALATTSAAGENWAWLAPGALRRIPLSVTWIDNGIEFGPPGTPLGHDIEVPALLPLAVHVWPGGPEAGPGQRVPVHPLRRSHVALDTDQVVIQVLGGQRISLQVREPGQRLRPRRPRMHITYEVETQEALIERELPFVVGVMGDFSAGMAERPPATERRFLSIDTNNFDDVMARLAPRLELRVEDTLTSSSGVEWTVPLEFRALTDFEPERVVRQIPPLAERLARRTALQELLVAVDGNDRFGDLLQATRRAAGAAITEADRGAVRVMLGKDDARADRLAEAWLDVARAAPETASDNPTVLLQQVIEMLDAELTAQLRPVMRHRAFAALEGTWRGLKRLVDGSRTDQTLKIRILDLRKDELAIDLAEAGENVAHTILYRLVYETEFSTPGGEPYATLVGDYAWDHQEADVLALRGIARVAAAAHAPFISAVGPGLFGLKAWRDLPLAGDLVKLIEGPEHASWRALRDSPEARFLVLTLPRALARLPYGARTLPVEAFAFEELLPRGSELPAPEEFCWSSVAFLLAGRLTQAFAETGAAMAIQGAEGGGRVSNLPSLVFALDDGGLDQHCPTEIGITDRRELELSTAGLLPLCHYRNTDFAVFFGAQTLARPPVYDRHEATANAVVAARLPFIMICGRFMHYLMVMSRDKVGSFMEASDLEAWLNRWIQNYTNAKPNPGWEMRVRYPLRETRIEISAEEEPGRFRIGAYLRPWLEMEELTVAMRVEASVPLRF